jgi:uncharacterized protein YihD (DUF1040 family)
VLIAQRFGDVWRDIRRQDLKLKSLTNRLVELTDRFAPEISDFMQNIQEMAENLTIIDRLKMPKAPKNASLTGRKDQTWAAFADRL